jgi:phosphotriesterase-related protein
MSNFPVGKVQTVLGPIEPEALGITLTHEHLFIDLTGVLPNKPTGAGFHEIYGQPLSADNVGLVRHHFVPNRDTALLGDLDVAITEAKYFKWRGGGTLVDVTNPDIGRDPVNLAAVSHETGLNIVMGAGHYVDVAHPGDMDARSEGDIVQEIVSDLTNGVDGTGIKTGIIGEIGCSWPLTPNERKVLRAAGRAQAMTGAPLLIHPGRGETAPLEITEVLDSVGADLTHTIIAHIDRTIFQRSTLKELAETGVYLEWDLFGREQHYYWANEEIDMPHDGQRIADIAWTIEQGFGDRIVVAHDICTKDRLLKYGGHGYFYLLARIIPRMRYRGYTEEQIDALFVGNPAAVLPFRTPKAG